MADRQLRLHHWWVYGIYGLVFVASATLIAITPAARQVVQNIAGAVSIAALLAALFQLVRDSTAHERAVWLKRDEQHFAIGVTSHMANVVFDKHVVFCEAYITKVQETVTALLRNGPTGDALNWAVALRVVRQQHEAWITTAMAERLEAFEGVLRKMGAEAHTVDRSGGVPELPDSMRRQRDNIDMRFRQLLPDLFGEDVDRQGASAAAIIQHARDILGIEQLVEMRSEIIRRAHEGIVPPRETPK